MNKLRHLMGMYRQNDEGAIIAYNEDLTGCERIPVKIYDSDRDLALFLIQSYSVYRDQIYRGKQSAGLSFEDACSVAKDKCIEALLKHGIAYDYSKECK